MTKNLDNEGLRSIADNYQLFYIDLWGVVHNGINLHKNAIFTLKEITKKNKEYVLLTNAPRPNSTVKIFLEKMGIIERAKNLQINMTFEQKDYMSFTLRRLLHKNLMGELFKVIFAFKSKKDNFLGFN